MVPFRGESSARGALRRLASVVALSLAAAMLAHAAEPEGTVPSGLARAGEQADLLVVDKTRRTLTLYQDGRVLRRYTGLQLGAAPRGHKRFEGDERTPEGRYTIDYGNPRSAYTLSLHIDYPNAADRSAARAAGRSPGGLIFLHGQPNGWPAGRVPGDWTDGCIALANDEIAEVWSLTADGTPIDILP